MVTTLSPFDSQILFLAEDLRKNSSTIKHSEWKKLQLHILYSRCKDYYHAIL